MILLLRACLYIFAAALVLILLGLIADALYARRITRRAHAPDAPRGSVQPIRLNPAGSPALLLIHGFADGPSVFAQLAPAFAAAGLSVNALHLSGFGIPPPQMAGTTLADWRQDVDKEIQAIRAQNPARPLWLLGHSLGGALAFDAALRPENHIAGVVMLAPLIQVSRTRAPLLSPRQWFTIFDRLLLFTDTIESRLPKDLRNPTARNAYRTDKYIHRDLYRALFATIDAISPRAADWSGPLFMAVSPTDEIVDSAATKQFFDATQASRAQFYEQPDAGHVLPLDNGHTQLAQEIIRFILAPAAPPVSPR